MHLICPQNFAQALFSISLGAAVIPRRNEKKYKKKIKKKKTVRQFFFFFFGGGGGINKVHSGRFATGVLWVYGTTFYRKENFPKIIGLSIECFLILKKQTNNL